MSITYLSYVDCSCRGIMRVRITWTIILTSTMRRIRNHPIRFVWMQIKSLWSKSASFKIQNHCKSHYFVLLTYNKLYCNFTKQSSLLVTIHFFHKDSFCQYNMGNVCFLNCSIRETEELECEITTGWWIQNCSWISADHVFSLYQQISWEIQ